MPTVNTSVEPETAVAPSQDRTQDPPDVAWCKAKKVAWFHAHTRITLAVYFTGYGSFLTLQLYIVLINDFLYLGRGRFPVAAANVVFFFFFLSFFYVRIDHSFTFRILPVSTDPLERAREIIVCAAKNSDRRTNAT